MCSFSCGYVGEYLVHRRQGWIIQGWSTVISIANSEMLSKDKLSKRERERERANMATFEELPNLSERTYRCSLHYSYNFFFRRFNIFQLLSTRKIIILFFKIFIFSIIVDLQFCQFLLCSKVIQSLSLSHTHTRPLFVTLSYIMFHHKWLDIVPCAVQLWRLSLNQVCPVGLI